MTMYQFYFAEDLCFSLSVQLPEGSPMLCQLLQ